MAAVWLSVRRGKLGGNFFGFSTLSQTMATTLPFYWNLSSAVKEERVDASVKLIDAVLEFQSQYALPEPRTEGEEGESDGDEDGSDAENARKGANEVDELNAEDVRYAIRRLVRGLASPRESSRLGFAVALTEVRTCGIETFEKFPPLILSSPSCCHV